MKQAWRIAAAALATAAVSFAAGPAGNRSRAADFAAAAADQAPACNIDLSAVGIGSNGTGWVVNQPSNYPVLTFNANAQDKTYALCQSGSSTTVKSIAVQSGVAVTLSLDGIQMSTTAQNLQLMSLGSQAKVTLVLFGDSVLAQESPSTSETYNNAAIHVPDTATLTVSGAGSLAATGGLNGAGIGGGYYSPTPGHSGAISITGQAKVEATGGGGCAGIGSCSDALGQTGAITISGQAEVEATGGDSAAGIGGGLNSHGGNITITGSASVKATGGDGGAGIGGGRYRGGVIGIECDPDPGQAACPTVTAQSGALAAAIGAGAGEGSYSDGQFTATSITIGGGLVDARGGQGGTGIGVGLHHLRGSVTVAINGGEVTATGGDADPQAVAAAGAGIGGGFGAAGLAALTINAGQVIATGGPDTSANAKQCGAGIGPAGELVGLSSTSMKPQAVAIGPAATVRAYAQCSAAPAIMAAGDNQAATPQYFVNAKFNQSSFNTDGVDLEVRAEGAAAVWETLQLPSGYANFAYTTGNTTPQTDSITAYKATADHSWLGRVVTASGDSTAITSGITKEPLAVKLDSTRRLEPVSLSTVMTGAWIDTSEGPFTYSITVLDDIDRPVANVDYSGSVVAGSGATAPAAGSISLDSNGVGTVSLAHGQAITMQLDYLHKVRVQQTSADQFTTSHSLNPGTPSLDTGLLEVAGPTDISFTNERRTAKLTISNKVTGPLADPNLGFGFKVCVFTPNLIANGGQVTYSLSDGAIATLTLSKQSACSTSDIVLKDSLAATMSLPGEAEVQVVAQPPADGSTDYAASYQITGGGGASLGTGPDSGRQKLDHTDLAIAFTHASEPTKLTVSKMVAGAYADRTQAYTFDLCFWTATGHPLADGTSLDYTGGALEQSGATAPADGQHKLAVSDEGARCATAQLRHGQSIAVAVPKMAIVSLSERETDHYTASYKVNNGAATADYEAYVQLDESSVIAFTNTHDRTAPVPSSVDASGDGVARWGIALAGALALALGLGRGLRRARKGRVVS
ncbi:MAG: hypothetical protein LBD90_00520 [Bifidobacteriaceae bacterium]|jgi:hypothetical protein|nr:hypothetical protein [Bifidobacteriaceae bacterium]